MFTKLICLLLLTIAVAQAVPPSDVKSQNKETDVSDFDEHQWDDAVDEKIQSDLDSLRDGEVEVELAEREAMERIRANKMNNKDDYDGFIRINPGETIVEAIHNPAIALTVLGVFLLAICGMMVWFWFRPPRSSPQPYSQMP